MVLPASAEESSFAGLEGYEAPVITDVFDRIQEHTHGSGIVEFSDGERLTVWFQGNGERKSNVGRIMAARMPAGSDQWGEPFVIADTPGMPDVNPTVYVDENDRLWLFWYPVLANHWESSQPKFKYAEKGHYESANGYTQQPDWDWQEIMYPVPGDDFVGQAISIDASGEAQYRIKGDTIRYLSEEQFQQWAHNDDPTAYVKVEDRYITDSFVVSMNNGYMDAVEYVQNSDLYPDELKGALIDLLEETADITASVASGATNNWKKWNPTFRRIGWQTKNKPLEITVDGHTRLLLPLYADQFASSIMAYSDDNGKSWEYSEVISAMGDIQAATVQKEDGTLRSYFRSAEPYGYLVYHESKDYGETWGGVEVETQLRHVGGFDIVKLSDGTWVMAITETIQDATENTDNRSRLNIAVSKDEGETWVKTALREDMTGISGFHYPAITLGEDESILVSYSYDAPDGTNNIQVAEFKKADDSGSSGGSSGGTTRYLIQATAGEGGTISPSGNVYTRRGNDQTFTIRADEGYQIESVVVDGENVGAVATYTFKDVKANHEIAVSFAAEDAEETELPFQDVPAAAWYRFAVDYVYDRGIMSGTSATTFSPDGTVTRGMVAQILYAMEGKPAVSGTGVFTDVNRNDWYADAVNWAAENGLVAGVGEGLFAPNDSITREQLAVILYRYAQYKQYDTTQSGSGADVFSDREKVSIWAADAVNWAVNAGLLSGKGNNILDPIAGASRAEVAQIFMNFCQNIAQ